MKIIKFEIQCLFIILAMIPLWISNASAATIKAASCSEADVQTAINTAAAGDTVSVPAGSCSWSSAVSWKNKNISVIGAGIGTTVITANSAFNVEATMNPASFRISRMTLRGSNPNSVIIVNSANTSTATKGWRIDNIRFNYNGDGLTFFIVGITWELIDHCVFNGTGYPIASIFGYLNSEGTGTGILSGTEYWNRNLNLGTDEAVYFEDIKVNFSGGNSFIFDLTYGGSAVLRHSTIKYNYFITHSARGNGRGGMKYEVYNNTFIGAGFYRAAQLRSGTGVIFNNTISGYQINNFDVDNQRSHPQESGCEVIVSPLNACDGSNSYDGNTESNGWPCLDQIGRGAGSPTTQPSVPLYAWNNGTTATCATGGACNNTSVVAINGACSSSGNWIKTTSSPHKDGIVDYVNNGSTPKPGYRPYTYPHPLITGSLPPIVR